MFFGIIVMMFNNNEYNIPHSHAKYGEHKALFSLDGNLIEGNMPPKQQILIKAWVSIHYDELVANWNLAFNGEALYKIEPLK